MKRVFPPLAAIFGIAAPAFATVSVSSPTNNATVTSPVQYVATATASTCASGVASMGIYVNDQLQYVVNGNSMNTTLSLAPGSYYAVVEEWDNCGGATTQAVNITVSTAASPSGVSVTSPAPNSTVTSPVTYQATATTSCASGVAAMGIYVNIQLQYQVNGSSLNTTLSLASGSYDTVVQDWDNCGGAGKTDVPITVTSGSSGGSGGTGGTGGSGSPGSDLSAPYQASCTDTTGTYSANINSYEIFGISVYYNGSVYLGMVPTVSGVPAGIRQFAYSGALTPGAYTTPSIQQHAYGGTLFISSNGNSGGILWMIDPGVPLQSGTPTAATLRAYDADAFPNALYKQQPELGRHAGVWDQVHLADRGQR